MPSHTVEDIEAVQRLRMRVILAAEKAVARIRDLSEGIPMSFLAQMKFEQSGFHPVEDRRLNLVEQINQTFTYLVSLAAADYVLTHHPDAASVQLNLGTTPGYDLLSPSADVAGEVFASVNRTNNRKLVKDVARISSATASHRYVFFYCPSENPGLSRLERFPQVQLVALSAEAVWDTRGGA
jgi:hypothetical protein